MNPNEILAKFYWIIGLMAALLVCIVIVQFFAWIFHEDIRKWIQQKRSELRAKIVSAMRPKKQAAKLESDSRRAGKPPRQAGQKEKDF